MTATENIRSAATIVGTGAPTGTPAIVPALYLDDSSDTWYSWPSGGGSWTSLAGGSHPFTAAATAPATPAAGDHWYDSDVGRLYQRVGTAWIPTARPHPLVFSLADYQDQADPVAAALAAMAAAYATAPESGATLIYGPGADPSLRFVCHVPPGRWGTPGTAYTVAVPVVFKGAAASAHGEAPASMLAGNFTVDAAAFGAYPTIAFEDIYLVGQHTIGAALDSNARIRFERCLLIEDENGNVRANALPLVNLPAGGGVLMSDCVVRISGTIAAGDRPVFRVQTGGTGYFNVNRCDLELGEQPLIHSPGAGLDAVVTNCSIIADAPSIRCDAEMPKRIIMRDNRTSACLCHIATTTDPGATAWPVIEVTGNTAQISGAIGVFPAWVFYDTSTATDPFAFESIVVSNNRFATLNWQRPSVIIRMHGDHSHAYFTGAHSGPAVKITNNTFEADNDGKCLEISSTALATYASAVVTGNSFEGLASATVYKVQVNRIGTVIVSDNHITADATALTLAVAATNCGRALISNNVFYGAVVDKTGTANALETNNI